MPVTQIVFVGGSFGAGKSTLCSTLEPLLPAKHLRASDLLRSSPTQEGEDQEGVQTVEDNQRRILAALRWWRGKEEAIILDGHFCLLDDQNHPVPVSLDVFQVISPIGIVLVQADVATILSRLHTRDNLSYSAEIIRSLSNAEEERATEVSTYLAIPLMIHRSGNPSNTLVALLKQLLNSRTASTE